MIFRHISLYYYKWLSINHDISSNSSSLIELYIYIYIYIFTDHPTCWSSYPPSLFTGSGRASRWTCRPSLGRCSHESWHHFSPAKLWDVTNKDKEGKIKQQTDVQVCRLSKGRIIDGSTMLHCFVHPSDTYITYHYISLHYITSHYIASHYSTSHYITSHYFTSHHITLHCIHTYS